MKRDIEHINHFPPPHWHGYSFNDTERAHSMEPWEECCGNDEDCVCVTTADTQMWNTISSISGLTGINFDNLSSYSAIAASSNLWNSNYDTVSANSALWNGVSGLDQLSALNSAYWQSASDIVSANSAKWNKIQNLQTDVSYLEQDVEKLSSDFGKYVKPIPDGTTITGDGTSGSPFGVKNYEDYIKLLNYYVNVVKPLYKNNTQNWISLDATTDQDGINPYLQTLFNAINKKDNDQDITLNNHGDLIQWILKHLNDEKIPDYIWQEVTNTAKSAISGYNNDRTIYYSVRNEA